MLPPNVFAHPPSFDDTSTEAHIYMQARLNFEISHRKKYQKLCQLLILGRLCEQLDELRARKKALTEMFINKQRFLASLPNQVNKLKLVILRLSINLTQAGNSTFDTIF